MNLRYISIGPNFDRYPNEYRYEFEMHTKFIRNFLSIQIRKHRFVTDGTFKMINVALVTDNLEETKIVPSDCLQVSILYDDARYEEIKGTEDCEYYLSLFEEGFKKASKFKEIPLQELLGLLEEFRNLGCKNEWLHKKKVFKEHDIAVALNCYFTTNDFKLVATINRISTRTTICKGVVLRTDPDEVCFQGMFKDILIDNDKIVITDAGDTPKFIIDLTQVLAGVLSVQQIQMNAGEMAKYLVS